MKLSYDFCQQQLKKESRRRRRRRSSQTTESVCVCVCVCVWFGEISPNFDLKNMISTEDLSCKKI
jgi:hypothetical protein